MMPTLLLPVLVLVVLVLLMVVGAWRCLPVHAVVCRCVKRVWSEQTECMGSTLSLLPVELVVYGQHAVIVTC